MDIKKKELLQTNKRLINVLRCYPDIERNTLAKYMGVSLPTLANLINELKGEGILLTEPTEEVSINKDSLILNPDLGMYFGVSIGASRIKITLVNFDFTVVPKQKFEKLKEESDIFQEDNYMNTEQSPLGYVCMETPSDYDKLLGLVDVILDNCIKLDQWLKKKKSCVMGIGFAMTGAIDNKEKKILKSYNLNCFNNMTISYDTLLYGNRLSYLNENNIDLAFENIARAAVISEKYHLYDKSSINYRHRDKKNIACIYLGSGVGAGLILNNCLYRGTSNFSELGHVEVCDPENIEITGESVKERCTCGGENCLELKIRSKALGMRFEEFKSISPTELKEKIKNDAESEKRLQLLGEYIGKTTNMLINILNLDLVIFTGKLTSLMDELWKYLNPVIASNKIAYTTTDCSMVTSVYGALAPSIGAAISSAESCDDEISWI